MTGSRMMPQAFRAISRNATRMSQRSFASSARRLEVFENVDQAFITKHAASEPSKVLLLDFYADWCQPCKLLSPSLRKAATQPELVGGTPVDLLTIDVDQHQDLAREYQVSSMPTVIGMKNGKPLAKFIGVIPEKKVFEFVQMLSSE